MAPLAALAAGKVIAAILALLVVASPATAGTYEKRSCPKPKGHAVTDCRVAKHGAPDLSRRAWRALFHAEVSITKDIRSLARNPAAGNARIWPLVDSLGQRIGTLSSDGAGGFELSGTGVAAHPARAVRIRGRGCAASLRQPAPSRGDTVSLTKQHR